MAWSPTYQRSREQLATDLAQIRGIGPKLLEKFKKLGVAKIEDALYLLPTRYEDRRSISKIAQLRDGCDEVFFAEVLAAGETRTSRSRRRLYEVVAGDGTGTISLKWFHFRAAWMKNRFKVGRRAFFSGEVKRFGAVREIHHPDVEFLAEGESPEDFQQADPLSFGRILPVYPLTEGLHQKTVRKIFRQVVTSFAPFAVSPIPPEILDRHRLLPLGEAFAACHWPPEDADLARLNGLSDQARRSLVFDEFFFLELGLALKRRGVSLEEGILFEVSHRYTKPLAAMLPYRLTDAQRRVLGEIKRDLQQPHPMNRLVQGDVGSGKTIVALMAALLAIENGCQVAVVAPTEILAEQHFLQFHRWLEALGLKAELLHAGITGSERARIMEAVRSGETHLLVGTHAVLQEGVEFRNLGLGIVDEQHRFGVEQRQVLRRKGNDRLPHILVMTATPIPRSLALTVFGDLALSVIDELPPGRTPVTTRVVGESERGRAYTKIRSELLAGHQAYIVYPLVEESEKLDLKDATLGAETLSNEVFPEFNVGLLHGRLKPQEKEAIMQDFKAGRLHILVSTTVIEVGIDVPNASVMMIEHAERFGLAQLHQLRGRVGRGAAQSTCVLVRSQKCSEDGMKRLQVMAESQDGFRIAEADLEIRGPGDFLGTRQSGLPDFRVANILRDGRMLETAREEAFRLASESDFLDGEQYADLRVALQDRWGGRLELAGVG